MYVCMCMYVWVCLCVCTYILNTETQLANEWFLEDINNILTSGQIHGLFPQEELKPLLGVCVCVCVCVYVCGCMCVCVTCLLCVLRALFHCIFIFLSLSLFLSFTHSRVHMYLLIYMYLSPSLSTLSHTHTHTTERLTKPAALANKLTTHDGLYEFFLERVRTRLHVVLCMTHVGSDFRDRCRMYPALINQTSIDWFYPWPETALRQVLYI